MNGHDEKKVGTGHIHENTVACLIIAAYRENNTGKAGIA